MMPRSIGKKRPLFFPIQRIFHFHLLSPERLMAVPSVVRRSFHAQASEDSYTASQESLRGLLFWPVSGRYSEKVGGPVSLSLMSA